MAAVLLAATLMPMNAETARAASKPKWQTAYENVLKNWRIVEQYEDLSYLKQYFGDGYEFDRYYIYDLNKDGTPELFLDSKGMGLTVVLTYKKGLRSMGYECIERINKAKKEIIVHGHWHGAGGSWDNEWSVYRISNNRLTPVYYIDKMNGYYSVYDYQQNKSASTSSAYNRIYREHIKSAAKVSDFTKYELSDPTGVAVYANRPKSTSIKSLSPRKKGFRVKWKKRTAKTKGYQIQYAANRKFKKARKITVGKKKASARTISGLKGKKRYYVRVRTYNKIKVNGKTKTIYSAWSKTKSVRTKR